MIKHVKSIVRFSFLFGSFSLFGAPPSPIKSAVFTASEITETKTVNGVQKTVKTKVWLPKVSSFKKGTVVQAKLVNTMSGPHGFEVPGLLKPVVVPGKNEKNPMNVSFTISESKNFKIKCHLHSAHVGADINGTSM